MADLIDRSELKKGLCAECTLLHGKCPEKNGGECDWDAIRHINSAPAVNAVPVVHGHWVVKEKMGKLICSNCGKGIKARGEMQIILAKEHEHYCYHCGARMHEASELELLQKTQQVKAGEQDG